MSGPAYKATLSWTSNQVPEVQVRWGSHSRSLEQAPNGGKLVDGHTFAAQVGMKFAGVTFKPEGEVLIDTKTGQRLAIPHRAAPTGTGMYSPAFRCKAAVSLGKTMLWVWAWDNMDASIEPSFIMIANEIGYENGKLKVLRQTELPGACGYLPKIGPRYGDRILIGSTDKTATLDLKEWRQIAAEEGAFMTPESGSSYRLDGNKLWAWGKRDHDWRFVREANLHYAEGAFTCRSGDLLLFKNGVMAASTGKVYTYPTTERGDPALTHLFFDPELGVAVVWYSGVFSKDVGILLDPMLRPRCPISLRS